VFTELPARHYLVTIIYTENQTALKADPSTPPRRKAEGGKMPRRFQSISAIPAVIAILIILFDLIHPSIHFGKVWAVALLV